MKRGRRQFPAGLPVSGSGKIIDFVTTAPAPASAARLIASTFIDGVADATMTGFLNCKPA